MNHISLALAISGLAYSGTLPPLLVDETVQVAVSLRDTQDFTAARTSIEGLHARMPNRCVSAKRQLETILSSIKFSRPSTI